jgi:hypothetical protein
MSEGEKDYSQFIGHLGIASHVFSIFAGFTLTVLVLFITGFSDPSPKLIQITLFLLCFIFDLFIFLLAWVSNLDIRYIKDIPPYTKGMKICSFLEYLGISLFGIVVTILFIFYNLIFLASASFIMFIVFLTLSYFYIMKPQMEIRIKQSNQ